MPIGNAKDALGERGEALVKVKLTRFHGSNSLFNVHHLGDKCPTVDFICELNGPWKRSRPFFFLQVKATRRGYRKSDQRLNVQFPARRATELSHFKVPVYLAGVDDNKERVFLIGVTGKVAGLTTIHIGHEIDTVVRKTLWKEVRDFWAKIPRQRGWTQFKEPEWD